MNTQFTISILSLFLFVIPFVQSQFTGDCINAIELCSSGLFEFDIPVGPGDVMDAAIEGTCIDLGGIKSPIQSG